MKELAQAILRRLTPDDIIALQRDFQDHFDSADVSARFSVLVSMTCDLLFDRDDGLVPKVKLQLQGQQPACLL